MPYLTLADSIRLKLAKKSESELYAEAKRFYDQSSDYSLNPETKIGSLLKAQSMYGQLLILDKDNENYFATLKRIDSRLFALDSNYNTYSIRVRKHIELTEYYIGKYARDTSSSQYKNYRKTLSDDYGNLSFYLLFVDKPDFNKVVEAAQKGLAIDVDDNDWINTNLALGYLLGRDFDKAKAIYKSFKGKRSNEFASSFDDLFLDDFKVLQRRRIITEAQPDVYKFVQQVTCWLKNEKGCSL